jgi:hypothetical protein
MKINLNKLRMKFLIVFWVGGKTNLSSALLLPCLFLLIVNLLFSIKYTVVIAKQWQARCMAFKSKLLQTLIFSRHRPKLARLCCKSNKHIIALKKCALTLILLMWRIGWAPNNISIYVYIQQEVTLHSLFISGNCSTRFGWYFHPSSGAHTTVSTVSGICHTVTAICRYCGRVGTGLSVLWVA